MIHPTIRVLSIDDEFDGNLPSDHVVIQAKSEAGWLPHTLTRDQAVAFIGAIVSRLNSFDNEYGGVCQGEDGDDFTARIVVNEVLKNAWAAVSHDDRHDVMAAAGRLLMTVANWTEEQTKKVGES